MPTSTFELEGYAIEHTPTESTWGCALLYIDNHINYKVCNDLKMYKAKELESIFSQDNNQKQKPMADTSLNTNQCAISWNNLLAHINIDMVTESDTKVKNALMNYFLSTHDRD